MIWRVIFFFDSKFFQVYVPKMQLRRLLRLWHARQLPYWSLQRLDPLEKLWGKRRIFFWMLFLVLVYNLRWFCAETLLVNDLNPTSSDAPWQYVEIIQKLVCVCVRASFHESFGILWFAHIILHFHLPLSNVHGGTSWAAQNMEQRSKPWASIKAEDVAVSLQGVCDCTPKKPLDASVFERFLVRSLLECCYHWKPRCCYQHHLRHHFAKWWPYATASA